MIKIIFILLLTMSTLSLKAQEVIVEIKVSNKEIGDYWIQVADRNCGANSNGLNSYGDYYSWSLGEKAKERKVCDAASKACDEFNGGGHSDWRLPETREVMALMTKCKPEARYATLKSERVDTAATIYFPYAGMISEEKTKPTRIGKVSFFWTSNGYNSSKYALALTFSEGFYNNPLESKKDKLSVRCVRTIK